MEPTDFDDLNLKILAGEVKDGRDVESRETVDADPIPLPILPDPNSPTAAVQRVMSGAVVGVEAPKWNLTAATKEQPLLLFKEPSVNILKEIKTMTLPLLAVWLSGPILSIVDTAVVGRTAGLAELAALGPATSLCDMSTYFFNFMCVVTTSQVANALVRKDSRDASRRVGDGVFAATLMGAITSLFFLSPLGGALVAAFTSSGGGRSSLYFPISLGYVRVRALGLVPALSTAVYQSACLARHNIRLPLQSVACAGVANMIFDCILVLGCGQGAVGAAWASVAAQVAAWAVLLRHENSLQESEKDEDSLVKKSRSLFSISGRTSNKKTGRDLKERCQALRGYLYECLSPASALAGKSAVVMALMSTASGCGPVGLAAHQVCQSVLGLFCPFGEALSQTVQGLLPQVNSLSTGAAAEVPQKEVEAPRTDPRRMTTSAKRLVKSLLGASVGLGALNAVIAAGIPLFASRIFTSDAGVAALMAGVAPWMAGILLFHAVSTLLEGVLFSTGDGAFLGKLYPINSALVCSMFYFLRRTQRVSLPTLWATMLLYNIGRVVQFSYRLNTNNRRPPLVNTLVAPSLDLVAPARSSGPKGFDLLLESTH